MCNSGDMLMCGGNEAGNLVLQKRL